MKRICLILIVSSVLLVFTGCSDEAAELYETARFEELQRNEKHARELYRKILDSHPGSDYAPKARERLSELNSRRPDGEEPLKNN
jgi:outer membrane protein assembly factor BamD (BamD/ComL family)